MPSLLGTYVDVFTCGREELSGALVSDAVGVALPERSAGKQALPAKEDNAEVEPRPASPGFAVPFDKKGSRSLSLR